VAIFQRKFDMYSVQVLVVGFFRILQTPVRILQSVASPLIGVFFCCQLATQSPVDRLDLIAIARS